MSESLEAKQVRVALVGAPCIGKTCMIRRFVENTFHGSQYNPTAGVDFFTRRLGLKAVGTVTFIILDIGAHAINSKMLPIYLNGIDLFLLAYDMTNSSTLTELRKWISIITAFSSSRNHDPSLALVGLKGDLEHLRAVRLDGHSRFAQEYNIPLSFLSSAKSGESVVTCFTKCAIYHLSPEAKQRVREHAIMQASLPSKRGSLAMSGGPPPHSHPLLPPNAQGLIPVPIRGSGGPAERPLLDPSLNSIVCSLQ